MASITSDTSDTSDTSTPVFKPLEKMNLEELKKIYDSLKIKEISEGDKQKNKQFYINEINKFYMHWYNYGYNDQHRPLKISKREQQYIIKEKEFNDKLQTLDIEQKKKYDWYIKIGMEKGKALKLALKESETSGERKNPDVENPQGLRLRL